MLSNSPGNMYFESAPFKLTQEFVDVMGGAESRLFQYFKVLSLSDYNFLVLFSLFHSYSLCRRCV